MASAFKVKPTHKAVKSYYAALATYADQSVEHEGALRSAFQNLLSETGRKVGWTLIPELSLDANGHQIRPDGTFRDEFTIERGYWEAKDTDDDLEAEIRKKIKRGYRLTNTIFEDTREGRLYQGGKLDMIANLRDPQQLHGRQQCRDLGPLGIHRNHRPVGRAEHDSRVACHGTRYRERRSTCSRDLGFATSNNSTMSTSNLASRLCSSVRTIPGRRARCKRSLFGM